MSQLLLSTNEKRARGSIGLGPTFCAARLACHDHLARGLVVIRFANLQINLLLIKNHQIKVSQVKGVTSVTWVLKRM